VGDHAKPKLAKEIGMTRTGWNLLATTVLGMIGPAVHAQGPAGVELAFDPATFDPMTVTIDGAPLTLRRYRIVYVGKPVEMAAEQPALGAPPRPGGPAGGPGNHEEPGLPAGAPPRATAPADPFAMQSMIVYVPEGAVESDDAAVILHVNNGGWFASPVREVILDGAALSALSDEDRFGRALAAGYVIVSLGTRGRGALAADGSFAGKAPAAVVDAKAAIRYLRLNDELMPGSAERIVITGTSGGGALSAVVAASGNSPDFLPDLAAIGAAGIDAGGRSVLRDDVFATIAYCPITDLGHADLAYEWQYGALRSAENTAGGLDDRLSAASATLAAAYPAYLEGLGLLLAEGGALNDRTMRETIVELLTAEIEKVAAAGVAVPAPGEDFVVTNRGETRSVPNTWLTVADGKVRSLDYDAFLRFVAAVTPLKTVPAFDTTANTGHAGVAGENTLFGSPDLPHANFTQHGWNGNEVPGDGSGPDDTGLDFAAYTAQEGNALARQIALIDPLRYLNSGADVAPYWYIRHGMIDRDTAFAVPVTLYHAVRADPAVRDVNFALPWLRPHSGNYDVLEAYDWLAAALEAAGSTDN
jgi:hypothetical protein